MFQIAFGLLESLFERWSHSSQTKTIFSGRNGSQESVVSGNIEVSCPGIDATVRRYYEGHSKSNEDYLFTIYAVHR